MSRFLGINWFYFASPQTFFPLAEKITPWCLRLAFGLAMLGGWIGLVHAPTDFQQGDAYRIIFLHVPAAWMSMFIYLVMCGWAIIGWIFNTRLSSMMAHALAPTGASFTFLALVTGALWGKPTWGTYWVWDARLTSELILLFLYAGYIALANSTEDLRKGDRLSAVLALVGIINLPIIYFSVRWWNTLHQGASVSLTAAPKMAYEMLLGMLLMSMAAWLYSIGIALWRVRLHIMQRESGAGWLVNQVARKKND